MKPRVIVHVRERQIQSSVAPAYNVPDICRGSSVHCSVMAVTTQYNTQRDRVALVRPDKGRHRRVPERCRQRGAGGIARRTRSMGRSRRGVGIAEATD